MGETSNSLFGALRSALNSPLLQLGQAQITAWSLLQLAFWLAAIFVAERLLRRHLLERVLSRTHLASSLQFAIGRFAGFTFILLGCSVALQVAGIDLSSLAIVAGAVGVGIGLGLQNIVSNFVSGIIILAERPIALGDRVEIGGVAGTVRRINLRSTTVVTNDDIAIIVPNSDFVITRVTNWTHGDPKVRFRLPFHVAYGTDFDRLRRVLVEVALAHPATLHKPEPALFFIGFGESSIQCELGVWTVQLSSNPLRYKSDLYFAIERALRECGFEIPFPQRDVRVVAGMNSRHAASQSLRHREENHESATPGEKAKVNESSAT